MYRDPYESEVSRPSSAPAGAWAKEGQGQPSRRQLIAEKLYREQHVDRPSSSGGNSSARGGLGAGPAVRPQLLMCYLCGQQFGTSSLHIHQPQCYVKKLLQWERGPQATRGPKPLSPDEFAERSSQLESPLTGGGGGAAGSRNAMIEEFNNQQYQGFTALSLVPCENCGRTFLPDRLVVHQRSCRPGNTARRVSSPAKVKPTPAPGSTNAELAAKPASAAALESSPPSRMSVELGPSSRGAPSADRSFEDLPASAATRVNGTRELTAARNNAVAVSSATAQLVRCRYCSRTFAPGRVEVHENVCLERNAAPPPPVDRRTNKPSTPNGSFSQPNNTRTPVASASPARPPLKSQAQRASPARAAALAPLPVTPSRASAAPTSSSSGAYRRSSSPTLDSIRNSLNEMTRELAKEEELSRTPRSRPQSRPVSLSPPPPQTQPASGSNGAGRSDSPFDPQSTRKPPPPSQATPQMITPIRPMVLPASGTSSRSESPALAPAVASVPSAHTPRPKFCGECGTSVQSSSAKFCVECGVRL